MEYSMACAVPRAWRRSLARNPGLVLTPRDIDALSMTCTRLERIYLTEANGGPAIPAGYLAVPLQYHCSTIVVP